MSDVDVQKVTQAATAVMAAIESLTPEERRRVLQSAAALHGVSLDAGESRSPKRQETAAPGTQSGTAQGKSVSLVEFLKAKGPTTNSEKIVSFAYYREHVEGKSRFARGDLAAYFGMAKLPKPQNFDRDFSKTVRRGWVHEQGDDSYLTQSGEAAVESGFKNDSG